MNDKFDLSSDDFEMRRAKGSGPQKPTPAGGIVEHTVQGGETLSHLSLQYYGSATKPYWMVIYEANQDLIGDNPNKLKAGLTLMIPELPADMDMKK